MKIDWIESSDNWREVSDACRTTIGKKAGKGEPSSEWKRKILMAEHSPIRLLWVKWKWLNVPYYVHVHLIRHEIGVRIPDDTVDFVQTSREDRTEVPRHMRKQTDLIDFEMYANAQAIIGISRKRLCNKADDKTKEAWMDFIVELQFVEPELEKVCVPECVYRGFCPEMDSCGFATTENFKALRKEYKNVEHFGH